MKPQAPKTRTAVGDKKRSQIQKNKGPKIPPDPHKKESMKSSLQSLHVKEEVEEVSIDSGPGAKNKIEEMVGQPMPLLVPKEETDLEKTNVIVLNIKQELLSDDDDVTEQQKSRQKKAREMVVNIKQQVMSDEDDLTVLQKRRQKKRSSTPSSPSFDDDVTRELSVTKLIAFIHDTLGKTKRKSSIRTLLKAFKKTFPVFGGILKNMGEQTLIEALETQFVVEEHGQATMMSLKEWQKRGSGEEELEDGEIVDSEEMEGVEVNEEMEERQIFDKEGEKYDGERMRMELTAVKKLLYAKLEERDRPTDFTSVMCDLKQEYPELFKSLQWINQDYIVNTLREEFHVDINGGKGTISVMKKRNDDGGQREERKAGGEIEVHRSTDRCRAPLANFADHTNMGSHNSRAIPKFDGPVRFPKHPHLLLHPAMANPPHGYHQEHHQPLFNHPHRRTLLPLPNPPPPLPPLPDFKSFLQRTLQCLDFHDGVSSLDTLNRVYEDFFGSSFEEDFYYHMGHNEYFELNHYSQKQVEVYKMGAEDIPDNIFLRIKYVIQDPEHLPHRGPPHHKLPRMYLHTPTPGFLKNQRVKDLADRIGHILAHSEYEISEKEMMLIYGKKYHRSFVADFYSLIPPPQYRLEALSMVTKDQIQTRFGQNGLPHFRLRYHQPGLHPFEEEQPHRAHIPQGHRAERRRLHSTTSSAHSMHVAD